TRESPVVGERDQRRAPVRGVRLALDEPPLLQGIDHLGRGAWRDAQVVGERREAQGAVAFEHPQRPGVRRGDLPRLQRGAADVPQRVGDPPERFGKGLVPVFTLLGVHRNRLAPSHVVPSYWGSLSIPPTREVPTLGPTPARRGGGRTV